MPGSFACGDRRPTRSHRIRDASAQGSRLCWGPGTARSGVRMCCDRETTMAKLVVGTFLTLDGVMQGPGGPDEDRSGGFAHGGWSVGYWDEAMGQIITAWTARADALLVGRTTYEIFAAHWPRVPDDDPVGAVLNRVPKYVATTTLKAAEWNNSTL